MDRLESFGNVIVSACEANGLDGGKFHLCRGAEPIEEADPSHKVMVMEHSRHVACFSVLDPASATE
jgi:hypothetical protein